MEEVTIQKNCNQLSGILCISAHSLKLYAKPMNKYIFGIDMITSVGQREDTTIGKQTTIKAYLIENRFQIHYGSEENDSCS